MTDEPEFDGKELLEVARGQFARDMEVTFGERWAEFSEELCGMLFELWSRAKGGEPLPWVQEEHETVLVDRLAELFKDHPRLRAAAVQGTLSVCETSGLAVSSSPEGLHLDHLQEGGIPKYISGEPSELQDNLLERLERLGLAPESTLRGGKDGYLPVLLDWATGELGGQVYGDFFVREVVTTSLECRNSIYWYFPDPKPGWSPLAHQPHVHIVADGAPEFNDACSWNMGTSSDGRDVIDSVLVPGSGGSSTVTATYTVVRRRE